MIKNACQRIIYAEKGHINPSNLSQSVKNSTICEFFLNYSAGVICRIEGACGAKSSIYNLGLLSKST